MPSKQNRISHRRGKQCLNVTELQRQAFNAALLAFVDCPRGKVPLVKEELAAIKNLKSAIAEYERVMLFIHDEIGSKLDEDFTIKPREKGIATAEELEL